VQQNIKRPIVSKSSLAVPVLAALTLLALAVYGAPTVLEELKTGQAYSLAVIFANGTKVYRDSSPMAFWINVGFHIFSFVMMILLSILMPCEAVIDYKRKVAEQKKQRMATAKEDSKE
jgi:hypothetical protein